MLRRLLLTTPLGLLILALTACDGSAARGPQSSSFGAKAGSDNSPPLYVQAKTGNGPDKGVEKRPPFVGSGADPIVVPDCRITLVDEGKQDVPSRYDGVLDVLNVRPGQYIKADQVLGKLDARVAAADLEVKKAKIVAAEADSVAAEKTRVEMLSQYERDRDLANKNALARADAALSKLRWERAISDAVAKAKAVDVAVQEKKQSEVALDLHELRSKIPGIVRVTYKRPGESLKNLEPVIQIMSVDRVRIEAQIEVQYLPDLQESAQVLIEPARMTSPQQVLIGHLQDVTAVAVSNDVKTPTIVSSSDDGTVRIWVQPPVRDGAEKTRWRERMVLRLNVPVRTVACTPRGAAANLCVAGTADGKVRIYDLAADSDQPLREFKAQHRGAVTCAAFTPDGKLCATGGEDRQIHLWDVGTGELRYTFPGGHRGTITSIQFTPQGKLVSAGRDNTLRLWALGTDGARPEVQFDRRSGDVPTLGVSPDGNRVLFDQGRALRVLSLPRGLTEAVVQNLSGATNFTTFALFSPDARHILTSGLGEGRVQLWQAPDGNHRAHEVRVLVGTEASAPTCAAFAPDSSFIVTGTRDRQVLVWPVPTAEEKNQFPAKVTFIEQQVEPSTRQVRVWAELENPRDALGRPILMPGGSVTLVINRDK
jgi:WD40 repeat protein